MTLVIDASVAIKWLLPETDSDKARSVLEEAGAGRFSLLAPELLPVEVASSLWKRANRGELGPEEIEGHFDRFVAVSPSLIGVAQLTRDALLLAVKYRHPIYDCLYVALALAAQCPLVTADAKLFRSFGPAFPQVRLLRDWK